MERFRQPTWHHAFSQFCSWFVVRSLQKPKLSSFCCPEKRLQISSLEQTSPGIMDRYWLVYQVTIPIDREQGVSRCMSLVTALGLTATLFGRKFREREISLDGHSPSLTTGFSYADTFPFTYSIGKDLIGTNLKMLPSNTHFQSEEIQPF